MDFYSKSQSYFISFRKINDSTVENTTTESLMVLTYLSSDYICIVHFFFFQLITNASGDELIIVIATVRQERPKHAVVLYWLPECLKLNIEDWLQYYVMEGVLNSKVEQMF